MAYTIKVNIEFVECVAPVEDDPVKHTDGGFTISISEADAINIDKCEHSALKTAFPAIRNAVSNHLTNMSKKKACENGEFEVIENPTPYRVDGEIGRFTFITHSVLDNKQIQYNTADSVFKNLHGKEYYRTIGFKEIALLNGDTEKSFRKTTKMINRFRHQEKGGTPSRTLHESTEKEGCDLLDHIEDKAEAILKNNGFSKDGTCQEIKPEYNNELPVTVDKIDVNTAIVDSSYRIELLPDILNNPVPYENPETTVNITVDDVTVKKQEENRNGIRKTERGKRKYIHNTILHVANSGLSYILNGRSTKDVMSILIAFIIHNGVMGMRFQFFTDGHKILNDTIFKWFRWYKNMGVILDWYHLKKKCKEQLSLALKGYTIRNEILEQLMPLLWHGCTQRAISYLEEISDEFIKNKSALERLITYLTRNTPYIPCYAARKELGLLNSSAIGEKMNDLVVSERQKHNGMSWSKDGSVALATITALKRNNEADKYFEKGEIDFKLAA